MLRRAYTGRSAAGKTAHNRHVNTISQKSIALADVTRPTMKNTSASASTMLMTCRAGRMIGAPLMRAESFRKAITEPVKVSAPMATPSDISTRLCGWMSPGVPMSKASGA